MAHPLKIMSNHAYVANGDTGLLEDFEIREIPRIDSVAVAGNEVVLKWRGAPGMRIQRAHWLIAPDWADVPESDVRVN